MSSQSSAGVFTPHELNIMKEVIAKMKREHWYPPGMSGEDWAASVVIEAFRKGTREPDELFIKCSELIRSKGQDFT